MVIAVRQRPRVSAEFGQLVQNFHGLSMGNECHRRVLEAQLEELASTILLGYRQGARVSLRSSIAAVFLEIPDEMRSVPIREKFGVALVCEGKTQYLVVSGQRDQLEDFIDDAYPVFWRRMYQSPY